MAHHDEPRTGETALTLAEPDDARLYFIGRIRTPWTDRRDCPRFGELDGPLCRIEVDPRFEAALDGIDKLERLEVLYWLHQSARNILRQCPRDDGVAIGTFAIRSPVRPNPIATSIVRLLGREGATLLVRGLDCLDGTPLIDLKPDRTLFKPMAPHGHSEAAAHGGKKPAHER